MATSIEAQRRHFQNLLLGQDPNLKLTPENKRLLEILKKDFAASNSAKGRSNIINQLKQILTGKNVDGSAVRPEFDSQIDPETGLLKDSYRLGEFDDISLNKEGLEKFRSEALREGPSAWANLQQQRIQMDQNQAMDELADQSSGQLSQGLTALAEQGGLGSGSRERMVQNQMRDTLLNRQKLRSDANRAGLDVSIQDETNRINQLGQLPGMEIQALQPEMQNREFEARTREFDIKNALGEIGSERDSDMNAYMEEMKKWAAGKTADAQKKAASGGKK